MRCFLSAFLLIALPLAAFSQAPAPPNKPEGTDPSLCAVTGRVVTAAEGSPVKAARDRYRRQLDFSRSSLCCWGGSVTMDRIRVALIPTEEEGYFGGAGRVKKDGTLQITSVKDGDYAINVWGLEHDWFVRSARMGSTDLVEGGLQVEKTAADGRIEIIVSSASAQVEGSVTDGDHVLIGAHVRITPEPETPYNRFRSQTARTDQTGRFSISGLAPGKYRVVATNPGSLESGSIKSEPQVLTLAERDHKTVELTISKSQGE